MRYTGPRGKSFYGDVDKSISLQRRVDLLVSQVIRDLKAPPLNGNGFLERRKKLADGSTIWCMVNMLGMHPIVRTRIESPTQRVGYEKEEPLRYLYLESGLLFWWFPIAAQDYPLKVHISGDLLSAYRMVGEGLTLRDYVHIEEHLTPQPKQPLMPVGAGLGFESSIYTDPLKHSKILPYYIYDPELSPIIPNATQARSDEALRSSQYSGLMKLWVQVAAGSGYSLEELFGSTHYSAISRGMGLLLSPNNEFWFVTLGVSPKFYRGILPLESQALLASVLDVWPSLPFTTNTQCRIALCYVLLALRVTNESEVIEISLDDVRLSQYDEYDNSRISFTLHTWQWARTRPEASIVVYSNPAEGVYYDCALITATVSWDDAGVPRVAMTEKERERARFYSPAHHFWTPYYYNGAYYYSHKLNTAPMSLESFDGYSGSAPIHAFYSQITDELVVLRYFNISYEKTPINEGEIGSTYCYSGAYKKSWSFLESYVCRGGFVSPSRQCNKTTGERFTTEIICGSHGGVSFVDERNIDNLGSFLTTPTGDPACPNDWAVQAAIDSRYAAKASGATIAELYSGNYPVNTHYTRKPHEELNSDEALVISPHDPTVYFYFTKDRTYVTFEQETQYEASLVVRQAKWWNNSSKTISYGETGIIDPCYGGCGGGSIVSNLEIPGYTDTQYDGYVVFDKTKIKLGQNESVWDNLFEYSYIDPQSVSASLLDAHTSAGNIQVYYNHGVDFVASQGYDTALLNRFPAYAIWIGAA